MEGLNDDVRPIPRTTTAWKPFRIPMRRLIPIQPGRRRPQDGQADEALIHGRDRRLGISSARKRQNRADIPDPEVVPGANSWQSGRTVQTRLEEMDFKR